METVDRWTVSVLVTSIIGRTLFLTYRTYSKTSQSAFNAVTMEVERNLPGFVIEMAVITLGHLPYEADQIPLTRYEQAVFA